MNNTKITIFTDGASRGNPGRGGWGSVVILDEKVIELGGRENKTTNNRMELTACIEGLSSVGLDSKDLITINTDSSYVINGITKWIKGWIKNGWITKTKEEVLNKDLWEKLADVSSDKKISWNYVGGHSGIVGNERCDEIATSFADNIEIELYNGPILDYHIKNILDLSHAIEKVSKKSHSKAKAFSYISKVDGKISVHSSWVECEARVRGKSGTLYKKAISKEQEMEIIEKFSNL